MRRYLIIVVSFLICCIQIDIFSEEINEINLSTDPVSTDVVLSVDLEGQLAFRKSELFIIGDSHSLFFDQAGIMKSHWTGPIHVATIYQLLKLGLNLYGLQQELARSCHYTNIGTMPWQCPSGKYDVPDIKSKDCVIFSFGFNDIQKNIYKYASDRAEDEIYCLVSQYILLLKEYESKYEITCIPMSIPPNPSPCEKGAMGKFSYGISGDFSTNGSSEERNMYTKYANDLLKKLCSQSGLMFLDIYDEISDLNGFLRKEYSDDYIHLKWDNEDLIKKIKSSIHDMMEVYSTNSRK